MPDKTLRGLEHSFYAKGADSRSSPFQSPHTHPDFAGTVRRDLKAMKKRVDLSLEGPLWDALLVQSVLGHAYQGHCEFREVDFRFTNATITDIIHAAGLDVQKIKHARQELVNGVYEWIDEALSGSHHPRLTVRNKPLLGLQFLRDYAVDPVAVLKGMVIAGFMDNYAMRMKTVDHYKQTLNGKPLEIGGGESYLVNVQQLRKMGFDFTDLATRENSEEDIEYLREVGIIVEERTQKGKIEPAYVRRTVGPGTSDDLAFIIVGTLFGQEDIGLGISAMLGAFVVDAVDTYDKCVSYPVEKGLDEQIGDWIQSAWRQQTGSSLVTDGEIMSVIYFSAKANTPYVSVSSSHRRLIEYPGERKLRPTIVEHMAFVQGQPTGRFEVGFNRMDSDVFYNRVRSRVQALLQRAA